jgi:hypothetical protein
MTTNLELDINGVLIRPTNGGGVTVEYWDADREETVQVELTLTRR